MEHVFIKMHGLGNDFVVLDRRGGVPLSSVLARGLAERRLGVGCDQVITLLDPAGSGAAARMTIHNPDGGEVEACGNATRCVGRLLLAESGAEVVRIESAGGLLEVRRAGDGLYAVEMGPARLDWAEIPLARAMDTLHLPLEVGPLADPVGVGMGNPHAVFFVPDAEAIDLAALGPEVEHHPLFPNRVNASAVSVLGRDRLRLRVWERGAGQTRACGTAACAAVVAAARRGLAEPTATVVLDGGALSIAWDRDGTGRVTMTGPAVEVFRGTFDPQALP
ncbi:diaminopimelate epimerase [Roseospirillum parvum]|uniref:Diaminopimelate epimerase n=1 Tax=Roseospirillum parvum TaxID=83401 RepID=A0A1G7WHJ9_9PROT|nr:diaminopimelate epimerase [Roseospirillum parvum]SDG71431.1 diaminopimelate epimerase [Roseospirillum parvum]